MPKMKTNKGAAKRFKRKGNGQLKRRRANRSHIMTKMAKGRKRRLRAMVEVRASDTAAVNAMIDD